MRLKSMGQAASVAVFASVFVAIGSCQALAIERDLSQGWRFHAGDTPDGAQSDTPDSQWKTVAVPHDWAIMDRADGQPPFDAHAVAGQDSGDLPGGVGWYRRHIRLDASEAQKVVRLNFEAIYMDAEIWLNGEPVARHPYGYTAFTLDLTGKLRTGDNVIAVRVDHKDPSSRWYAGSGIIRPVKLELLDCAHIVPDSVFVATPQVSAQTATVSVQSRVSDCAASKGAVERVWTLRDPTGKIVAQATRKGTADVRDQSLSVASPRLWSPETPHLYTLVQELKVNGVTVDERRTRFGIRSVTMDAVNGLRINGEPYKLKGGNIHHDNYMLGAAGWPDADRRKVALMKAAGYNAIRSAHNPASQATLEAADELGMLVINEAFDSWNRSKRDQDYARFFADNWRSDIDSLVLSGRNHPSVILWSIGNEIPEQGTPLGVETGKALVARIRALDPSRAVTQGVNADPPFSDAQFAVLDVAGYNYRVNRFDPDHKAFPDRVMYTSESTPKDAFDYWRAVETKPWVIGDFVWTAVDYLGETGIGWMGYSQDWQQLGPYPWHLAYCGEIDATGRKRPAAYYREVLWKTGKTPVSMFVRQPEGTEDLPDRQYFPTTPPHLDWSLEDIHPNWTWPGQEGKPLEVVVFSEWPEVELFLNGRSLGRKAVSVETQYRASFKVRYAPGRLVAVGYRNGRKAAQWELRTSEAPVQAKVVAERRPLRANGQDLAYVTVELFDAQGTPVYTQASDRQVTVRVSGAGTLAGFGNGNPRDASSLQSGIRRTFHGRAVAVVRAGTEAGPVWLDVQVEGLAPQRVGLQAVKP